MNSLIEENKKIVYSKYQEDIFDAVLNTNKNIVIKATAGCLHPNTPILMFDGSIKTAYLIKEGDLLMGPDSTSREVLNVKSGQDQLYKIIPQKGMSWICNSTHVLTVHNEYIANSIKRHPKTSHTTPIQDISIQKLLAVTKMTVSRGVKSDYLTQYRLQRTGVEFNENKTLIPSYLMGLWLGDGTTGEPNITTQDQEIIDYCQSLKFDNIECKIRPDNNCFTICLTIKQHSKNAKDSNVVRNEVRGAVNKNNHKFIPKEYLINSRQNRLELLAGLIDSDGYFDRVYGFCTKFETLKDDVLFLCRSLGLAAYAVYRKSTIKSSKFEGWYWNLTISGDLSVVPVLLPRKKAQIRKQIKSVLRTGFKIEDAGHGDWCGFQVDKDNRFLLGDFTITHNSGKSSTIITASKMLPPNKEILFAAFNKSIVEELSLKLPSHILCSTLHSIGMKALMSHFRTQLKINEFKFFSIMEEIIKAKPVELRREEKQLLPYKFILREAINLVRMTMTPLTEESIFDLCGYYSIDLLQHEVIDVIEILTRMDISNRSLSRKYNSIDYVDMIHLCVMNPRIKLPQFDYIFMDEVQDTNRAQQAFIERMVKPNTGRTICVGDPRQAIYSFMGADINSFDRLSNKPNTVVLPLSISYRCARSIVQLAQSVYPEIEPWGNSPEGEIRYGSVDEAKEGDFILCRNNRPLMYVYFDLLGKGKNPIIIGKDIQEGLEALLSKVLKKTTEEGMEIINDRLIKLEEELKSKGIKNTKEHPRYTALYDKVKTIEVIAKRFDYIKQVKEEITRMFEEKENCIKLMSCHKSKGLEANRVFIIERFEGKRLMPSPYALSDWEKIQEQNIKFVAFTRARRELIFIPNIM